QRGAEGGMIRAEKGPGQVAAVEPARRLREARGREIEPCERGEFRKVAEPREESGHQERGGVCLEERLPLVLSECLPEGGWAPRVRDRFRQARDPQQRQGKSGREKRIHERGRGGKERPVLSGGPAAPEGKLRSKGERENGARTGELTPHRRE